MYVPEKEQRPGAESEALSMSIAGDDAHSTACSRCEQCNRPLTARRSVERGRGPVCCLRGVA